MHPSYIKSYQPHGEIFGKFLTDRYAYALYTCIYENNILSEVYNVDGKYVFHIIIHKMG